jgi:SAM-dependent methyltransferase
MSNARKQLERWLKTIDVKGTVLDVGGVSMPVKGRTKSWDVSDYKILDNRKKKPEATTDYVYDMNMELPVYAGSFIYDGQEFKVGFDNIFCLEVMEYIWNPVQALKNINNLLNKGGNLYISFHFLFPHHSPPKNDYLRYTRIGAKKLLEETGFKIVEITPRTTVVPDILEEFCKAESKVNKSKNEIGYLIKAKL